MSATEDQRGNAVAKAIWKWLQEAKRLEYVPWVIDPCSKDFDPTKAAIQAERKRLLGEIDGVIAQTVAGFKPIEEPPE